MRLLILALFVFLPPGWADAHPSLKVVNGKVKEIRIDRQELVLSYQHPVNGRREELMLKIDPQTGFAGGFRLEDLEGDDPVSVDYQEDPEGLPRAVLVKRVPLRGVPIHELASR